MAYNQFAEVYDILMEEAPYDEWADLTEAILIERNFPHSASILDLGCGTGEIAIRLNQRGYELTGVDYSSEMLSIAQQKAVNKGEHITWIHQDMVELDGFKELDVCISYCDVMNYLTGNQDVLEVCRRVADSLQAHGLFIFDVHDAVYAEEQLADHTFAEVNEDIAYIWECSQDEKEGHLLHDLTFFKKLEKDQYVKFTEVHEQQVHPLEFYERVLKQAGFNKIVFFSDFHKENDNLPENRMRNFIIAEK